MRIIELEEARGLLARAVLTQPPDFVYTRHSPVAFSCANVPITHFSNGTSRELPEDDPARKTGCLIGTAINKIAGVPIPYGAERYGIMPLAELLNNLFWYERVVLSPDAEQYFLTAQVKQDSGMTWTEAYQVAEQAIIDGTLLER
jgi:hypothetical protein